MKNCSVTSLWIQGHLPHYVLVCINSFLHHKHHYTLFTYGKLNIPGVDVRDAREILPEEAIFQDEKTGSLAHFSDLFRWTWLREKGGIWIDADIACIRDNIPLEKDIYLSYEDNKKQFIAATCVKLPAGHILADTMYELSYDPLTKMPWETNESYETRAKLYAFNTTKEGRIEREKRMPWAYSSTLGLTQAVRYYNMLPYIRSSQEVQPIHYKDFIDLYNGRVRLKDLKENWGIHLWGNEIRKNALSIHTPSPSLMTDLLEKYGMC